MNEQTTEILTDNRSSYAWLGVFVVLAIGAGAWFIPKMGQPLIGWLVIAIICLPASLVFVLGTFTRYFDLKLSAQGISFGGFSGPRKFTWEEITDVLVVGDKQCKNIALVLNPLGKDERVISRPNEVLPKLYGLEPAELQNKLKQWRSIAMEPLEKKNTNINSSDLRKQITDGEDDEYLSGVFFLGLICFTIFISIAICDLFPSLFNLNNRPGQHFSIYYVMMFIFLIGSSCEKPIVRFMKGPLKKQKKKKKKT